MPTLADLLREKEPDDVDLPPLVHDEEGVPAYKTPRPSEDHVWCLVPISNQLEKEGYKVGRWMHKDEVKPIKIRDGTDARKITPY